MFVSSQLCLQKFSDLNGLDALWNPNCTPTSGSSYLIRSAHQPTLLGFEEQLIARSGPRLR